MTSQLVMPSVSVSVSFSPVRGRSDETRSRVQPICEPSVNPSERPWTHPIRPPTQLESVLASCRILPRGDTPSLRMVCAGDKVERRNELYGEQ